MMPIKFLSAGQQSGWLFLLAALGCTSAQPGGSPQTTQASSTATEQQAPQPQVPQPDQVATMIDMNKWSGLPDAAQAPVAGSLAMMAGLNQRFIYFLQHLTAADLQHSFYHPVRQIQVNLKQAIFMAGWHGFHHLAHIDLALGRSPRAFDFSK
jgi:hypothetical protein